MAQSVSEEVFKVGKYLAKLQAITWLSRALSSSFSSVLDRRAQRYSAGGGSDAALRCQYCSNLLPARRDVVVLNAPTRQHVSFSLVKTPAAAAAAERSSHK